MIDDHNRGERCAHRAAVELKLNQSLELNSDEIYCLRQCSGRAYSCNGSVSLRDVEDFSEIFHKHIPLIT